MPEENNLTDRKGMALVRCSLIKQKKESFPQQVGWLRDFADENGMIYVGELQQALAVSQTDHRPDIEYLLHRARTQKDFDTLLVQDMSRLTRGGLEHGLELYFQFKAVGVLICTIVDGLIDGEEKLKEAIKRFEEARAHSRASALNLLRGKLKSRKDGRSLYASTVPYGLDRLYSDEEGKPLHIIRSLADGTQVQLDPTGHTIMRTFGRNEDGACNHYVKQKNEFVTLIAGDPERVAVVQRIFRRYFIDQCGFKKITRELNYDMVPAIRGGLWCSNTVHTLLRNSIYFGIGIGNRKSKAIYYRSGINTPQPVVKKPNEAIKGPFSIFRPEHELYEQVFPNLENLLQLDDETKQRVRSYQRDYLKRTSAHISLKRGGDRYPKTEYILRDVIWAKQMDRKMTGCTMGKGNGRRHRYYRVTKAYTCPNADSVARRLMPAGALEDAAISVLKDATSSFKEIDPVIHDVIKEEAASLKGDEKNIEQLERDMRTAQDQIDFYVNQMSMLGAQAVAAKTEPFSRKVRDIYGRIEMARQQRSVPEHDVAEIARIVRNDCVEVMSSMDGLTRQQLRLLMQGLMKRVTVDLETKEATMEVHMPSWLATSNLGIMDKVCADRSQLTLNSFGASADWSIPLATYTCSYQRVKQKPCMACVRLPRTTQPSNLPLAA